MNTEEIKKWMEGKGFDNSALAIDSNHRVSLYLSDVLDEFNKMLVKKLTIHNVSNSLSDLDGKTVSVKFKVTKFKPNIILDIDLANDY